MSLVFTALALAVSPVQETPAPAAAPAKEEPKICKTESFSGSRLRAKRVCRTEAEWRNQADRTGQELDRRD